MGLGPPVCLKCMVIGEYVDTPVPMPKNAYNLVSNWVCPICGDPDMKGHAGFDTTKWKVYKDNLRFLQFVKGE